jgi:RNA polymerase sigma-70 factor (ECF subfamily)
MCRPHIALSFFLPASAAGWLFSFVGRREPSLGECDEARSILEARDEGEREKNFAEVFTRHRDRLRSMVDFRLDPLLRARVDPSDVLQEAYLEAAHRLPKYIESPDLPLFLWLRSIAGQTLARLQRFHLGADRRDPRREVSSLGAPATTTRMFVDALIGRDPSPSAAARFAEMKERLEGALDSMEEKDREILALRHFEELSSAEAARVLQIDEEAARKRYYRALEKLKMVLGTMPGGLEGI